MGKFSKIPKSTFDQLQIGAGVLLKGFDPAEPALDDANIICATTGGVNAVCTPVFADLGTDIDNCPENTKELKEIIGYNCTLGFTSLSVTTETIRMSLGAADIEAETGKITPRHKLKNEDFADVWWVGDRSDDGFAAVCLKNALSTGGFNMQTTKAGKGQMNVTLTGHYSIEAQDDVPMQYYVLDSEEA